MHGSGPAYRPGSGGRPRHPRWQSWLRNISSAPAAAGAAASDRRFLVSPVCPARWARLFPALIRCRPNDTSSWDVATHRGGHSFHTAASPRRKGMPSARCDWGAVRGVWGECLALDLDDSRPWPRVNPLSRTACSCTSTPTVLLCCCSGRAGGKQDSFVAAPGAALP
jgi:hypothetical protein